MVLYFILNYTINVKFCLFVSFPHFYVLRIRTEVNYTYKKLEPSNILQGSRKHTFFSIDKKKWSLLTIAFTDTLNVVKNTVPRIPTTTPYKIGEVIKRMKLQKL